MAALLGIDLGTSSVKAVVIDEAGQLLGVGAREIPMEVPEANRAEQDPAAWWSNTVMAVRAALHKARVHEVAAIGLDGHMHGFVLLDSQQRPVGRAITWADQRAAGLIPEIEAEVGVGTFLSIAGTRPAAGFMGPTMVWLARHDPGQLEAASVAVCPRTTCACASPARWHRTSATPPRRPSSTSPPGRGRTELCGRLGVPERLLPPLLESSAVAGRLSQAAAAELGLEPGVPVVAGCADQPAQAIANGLLDPGNGSVTLGTGGQIIVATDRPLADAAAASTPSAMPSRTAGTSSARRSRPGSPCAGCATACGCSPTTPTRSLDRLARDVPDGADGLIFLPYLVGERSPIMQPDATAAFVGLT